MLIKDIRNLIKKKEEKVSDLYYKVNSSANVIYIGSSMPDDIKAEYEGVVDGLIAEIQSLNEEIVALKSLLREANNKKFTIELFGKEVTTTIDELLFLLKQSTAIASRFRMLSTGKKIERINQSGQREVTSPTYQVEKYAEMYEEKMDYIRTLQNKIDLLNLTIDVKINTSEQE